MSKANRLAIIASHGSLDAAYPPLILATAALAMEMEAGIFFTFYGLQILKKGMADKLKVEPIANPALPQPVPGVSIPNIVGVLPGMTAMATSMMHTWLKKSHVATVSSLLDTAVDMGVRLIACQMTMDVMGITPEQLIDGIEIGGAATFLDYASEDAITLAF
jgi:peroxiredoxin family protein